jgi:hypothetical protein
MSLFFFVFTNKKKNYENKFVRHCVSLNHVRWRIPVLAAAAPQHFVTVNTFMLGVNAIQFRNCV